MSSDKDQGTHFEKRHHHHHKKHKEDDGEQMAQEEIKMQEFADTEKKQAKFSISGNLKMSVGNVQCR